MRKIFLIFLIFFATTLFAQQNTEYCILRVTYSVKPNNLESKLFVDLGSNANHSLKGIFENTKGGTISINNVDGTVTVIKDEVDFFTIVSNYGFKLINSYTITLLEKSYANFVFEKKKDN